MITWVSRWSKPREGKEYSSFRAAHGRREQRLRCGCLFVGKDAIDLGICVDLNCYVYLGLGWLPLGRRGGLDLVGGLV